MEKSSFCEHVRHKTKQHIDGELDSRQGQLAPENHSAVMAAVSNTSWTTFKFTIKSKKRNYTVSTLAAFLGPLKVGGRISGLRLGGGRELILLHVVRGCPSLSTMFQSWNSECKSLADERGWEAETATDGSRRLLKFSSKHHL